MPVEFLVIIALCFLAALATIPRWRVRIGLARSALKGKRLGAVKLSSNIREQAKTALAMKRSIRRIEAEMAVTQKLVEEAHAKVAQLESFDSRLLVVDDQRGRADIQWMGTVQHPDYQGQISAVAPLDHHNAWQTGKNCLVWAKTEERARSKLQDAFPKSQGYSVVTVVEIAPVRPGRSGGNEHS
jgi:hypothetical protein